MKLIEDVLIFLQQYLMYGLISIVVKYYELILKKLINFI
jgi:hypothetical protein